MLDDLPEPLRSVIYQRRFLLISALIASIASVGILKLKDHLHYLSAQYLTSPKRNVPIKLSDLPLELQIQVLSLLEWHEVLRARQTCRRLRDASLSRPIWLSLFKFFSATEFPRPFCLEKPLDLYTGHELEHLVLRREKARICWLMDRQENALIERRFDSVDKARNCVHLVEGGRWLLVGSHSGSVLCFDLDSPIIESSTLIPPPFDEETIFDDDLDTEIRLSVDMDLDAEYLTFNLGIITRRMPEDEPSSDASRPPYFRWVQVWRVSSDMDKDGKLKGLRAQLLVCFPEQHQNRCDAFRLQGRHVAYALHTRYKFSSLHDGPCIIVVGWSNCDSGSLVYPRKVLWRIPAEWLALLPGNRLLSHCVHDVLLFDLNDASMTTLDPSNYLRRMTRSDPVAELPLFVNAISQPYFFRHSVRFSVLTRDGVRGVIIPHPDGASPNAIECVDLCSTPGLVTHRGCIGYDRALVCYNPKLIMLQFTWPEDLPYQFRGEKTFDGTEVRWPDVLFDAASGQIMLSMFTTKKQLLLNTGYNLPLEVVDN